MTKVHSLKSGDSVGIVAPSSLFSREKFDGGIAFLESLGLRPIIADHVFSKDLMFSGTVQERVQDIVSMLKRKDIKALWCVRGGAGAYAVAQEVAKVKGKFTPKILLGMSDVTALHLVFTQKFKWPVLHSPLFDRLIVSPPQEKKVLEDSLLDKKFKLELSEGLEGFGKQGVATGILTGGNLSLLAASLGSSWEVDTNNKILFIEDTGERAYRIDRMLTQLKSAGKFKGLKGVVVGDFTDCKEPDGKVLWPLVMKRHFEGLSIPCVMGFPSGHGDLRLTVPFGVKAKISTQGKATFQIAEGMYRD